MMAHICKYGLVAQALLTTQAFAARMSSDEFLRPPNLKDLLTSHSNIICGEQEIWSLMTQSSTLGSVQNIQWGEVMAKADEYIKEQTWAADTLSNELEGLNQRIEEKRKQESKKDLTQGQVVKLISDGLSDFGGLQHAQRTKCGHPSIRPPVPRTAFRQASVTFRAAATDFFDGTTRVDGEIVSQACTQMLPCPDDSCYCEQLCNYFTDIAQELSDTTVGALAGSSSDELMTEYAQKKKSQQFHADEAAQCKKDKLTIEDFSQQLNALKTDIKDKFNNVQAAEWALDGLMYDMTAVEDSLKASVSEEEKALQVLSQYGNAFQVALNALNKAKADEANFNSQLTAGKDTLGQATQHLDQAKSANRVVTLLKSSVSTVMLRMALVFKVAVLTPVKNIGWDEELSLDKYFHADPAQTKSGLAVKEAVSAMEVHCQDKALKAFTAVANTVDLRPLCSFGKADAISKDVTQAITARTANLRQQIEIVVSWLNPYQGQQITKDQVKQAVAVGEPEGLREIVNVYGNTQFFQYLRRWAAGGEFLQLINMLGQATASMDAAVKETEKMLQTVQQSLGQVILQREEATRQVEAATSRLAAQSARTQELQQLVRKLKDQSAGMRDQYAQLLENQKEAQKKWEAAKVTLVNAHKQATSFLEALQGDSLEVLEERDVALAEEISRLERSLEEAENAKLEMAMNLKRLQSGAA